MNLKDYVMFKLRHHEKLNLKEKEKLLLEIYKDMEKRGHSHHEIFEAINEVAVEKMKRARLKLEQTIKKLEEKYGT